VTISDDSREWTKLPIIVRGPPINLSEHGKFDGRFEVMARLSQPAFDQGDPISIEIYITGWGRCDASKISIVYPFGFLAGPPEGTQPGSGVGEAIGSVMIYGRTEGNPPVVKEEIAVQQPTRWPLDTVGAAVNINRGYFMPRRKADWPDQLPAIVGETKVGQFSPILIRTQVSSKAPPGDHVMSFFFTYRTGQTINISRQDLTIHVRPFWEKRPFQTLTYVLLVAATVGTVLGTAAALGWRI
jgi:hypothetical protein